MMRRTIEAELKHFGPDYPGLSSTFHELAKVLKQQGRLGDAEELLRRRLAAEEKTFGHEHENTLLTLLGLAELLNEQGEYKEALLLFKRALPGSEKRWGKEKPWIIRLSKEYSDLLERLKATFEESHGSSF
jgi:tetratricopeptide (TPR) repeat protein